MTGIVPGTRMLQRAKLTAFVKVKGEERLLEAFTEGKHK